MEKRGDRFILGGERGLYLYLEKIADSIYTWRRERIAYLEKTGARSILGEERQYLCLEKVGDSYILGEERKDL